MFADAYPNDRLRGRGASGREFKELVRLMAHAGHEIHIGGPHHRGRRGGQRGFGEGPWGGPGGFPFGPGGPFGRGRKARRGDIRTAALLLIAEEPRNGYQIMQEVQERSEGAWRVSPGSVYPALSQLEDEGLIRLDAPSEGAAVGKRYMITDAGQQEIAGRPEDAKAPWELFGGEATDELHELGNVMRSAVGAFVQVMRTGSESQITEARRLLVALRKDLYRVLAADDPSDS